MKAYKRALQIMPVVLVLMLAGCDWFKGGKKEAVPSGTVQTTAGGDVLISQNGKPLLTVEEAKKQFDPFFEQIMQQPQAGMMAQYIGIENYKAKQFENFCKMKLGQIVLDQYAKEQGFEKDPEYQKKLNEFVHALKFQLDVEFLEKTMTAGEAECKAYYEEHKNEQPILISRGGVAAFGVVFENEADAKAFLSKAKGTKDLKKLAETEGLSAKFRDFGAVNEQSPGIDAILRNKIVDIKTFPATELVKVDDKTFWVVVATAQEEEKYLPFDQIKEQIEKFLIKQKTGKEVEQLQESYGIKLNEDYFKTLGTPAPGGMQIPGEEIEEDVVIEEEVPADQSAPVEPKTEMPAAKVV